MKKFSVLQTLFRNVVFCLKVSLVLFMTRSFPFIVSITDVKYVVNKYQNKMVALILLY